MAQPAVVLRDSTPVQLRLSRNFSMAAAAVGQTVNFEVSEDVKVGNLLVIARGGAAVATITEGSARSGNTAKVDVNIDYVRLVSDEKVLLRAVKSVGSVGRALVSDGAVALTSLVSRPSAPLSQFARGTDLSIPEGASLTAYVAGDFNLDPSRFPGKTARRGSPVLASATLSASAGSDLSPVSPVRKSMAADADRAGATPAPPAPPVVTVPAPRMMTNLDVIELKMAGFSDPILIAKIEGTPANYGTNPEEMIALKKANVSEAVIQAMLEANSRTSVISAAAANTIVAPLKDDAPESSSATGYAPYDLTPPGGASNASDDPRKRFLSRLRKSFSSGPFEDNKGFLPAADPPAPPQYALTPVTIMSRPIGARIYIDGYPAGVTPAVVKLIPGTYKLTLVADGLPLYTQQITVDPGEVSSVGVSLNESK